MMIAAAHPPPSVTLLGAEALYLAGIVACAAVGLATSAFGAHPSRAAARLAAGAWIVATLGAVALFARHRGALRVGIADFVATPLGDAALVRLVGLGLAYGGVVVLARRDPRAVRAGVVLLVGALISVVGHSAGGHPAGALNRTWAGLWQAAHIGAAVVWVGGLAAALALIRRQTSVHDRRRVWLRLSAVAGWAFVVLTLSGTVRVFASTADPEVFLSSTYGRLVVVKLELLVLLAIMAARNRYWHLPSGTEGEPRVRRLVRAEVAIAGVVLAISAYLVHSSPPTTPQPVVTSLLGGQRAVR